MVRWIILLLIGYLLMRFLFRKPKKTISKPMGSPQEIADEMVEDCVCKVYLPKRQALVLHRPGEKEQYFCSLACKEKYLKGKETR